MRITYSILYDLIIVALIACTVIARRSDRPTKNSLAFLEAAVIPPIFGNLMIIQSKQYMLTMIGYYIYFLGMDLLLLALVYFTNAYCKGIGNGEHKPTVIYIGLAADAVQMIFNVLFGHAFDIEYVGDTGLSYFRHVPFFGQTVHRIVDYVVLFCVILIYTLASVKTPRIYREKYSVILGTMLAVGVLQSFYLVTKSTYDRSVLGYGVFGLVIFYFAMFYRPLRFLDQMLSNIVSGLPDAFFVFDPNGGCVWANNEGCRLAGVTDKKYEQITPNLHSMFGEVSKTDSNVIRCEVTTDGGTKFYDLEESQVKGSDGKLSGYYLRIQDVTDEETEIRVRDEQIGKISRDAYKDVLTGVGTKAAYTRKMTELDELISGENAELAVVMVDLNDLKGINDMYGHKAGDEYIRGCSKLVCHAFKHSPVFRIGGDEFVAILREEDFNNRSEITEKLRADFKEAYENEDNEPWMRFSAAVGIAEAEPDDDSYEQVFRRADKRMYEEKHSFKEMHGSYR